MLNWTSWEIENNDLSGLAELSFFKAGLIQYVMFHGLSSKDLDYSDVPLKFQPYRNNEKLSVDAKNMNKTTDTLEWIGPWDTLPNGEPTFVHANKKSTVTGVSANPKRENFIFGFGRRGAGYYHENTRDAYQIICTRVKKKIFAMKGDICQDSCLMIFFFPCISSKISAIIKMKKQLLALEDMSRVMERRKNAKIPLGFSKEVKGIDSKSESKPWEKRTNGGTYGYHDDGEDGAWDYDWHVDDCSGGLGGGFSGDFGGGGLSGDFGGGGFGGGGHRGGGGGFGGGENFGGGGCGGGGGFGGGGFGGGGNFGGGGGGCGGGGYDDDDE